MLAGDYFNMVDIPRDFSYDMDGRENKYPSSNDISINDVSFSYPEKPDQGILKNITLNIPSGRFIGIAGPSGCGKSTLIKLIDKLEKAHGDIFFGGAELSTLSRKTLA